MTLAGTIELIMVIGGSINKFLAGRSVGGLKLAAALIAAAVVFLVYLPTLANEFVLWDDNVFIYNNPRLGSFDFAFIRWAFGALLVSTWIPLTLISFGVDYALWGLDPWGFHLTNNLLHAANTFLVFFLFYRLVELGSRVKSGKGLNTMAFAAAIVTALLFGLHPMRVESVAWASQRKDVLYGFFYILSIIIYLRYARLDVNRENVGKWGYYLGALILFACSALSKPMAVTLPAVLLILDYYPLKRLGRPGRWRETTRALLEKAPFFIITIYVSLMTFRANIQGGELFHADISEPFHSSIILLSVKNQLFYLYKLLLPLDLAPIYHSSIEESTLTFQAALLVLIFLAITVYAVGSLRKRPAISVVWFFYIVALSPVYWIPSPANRHVYLAALGPMLLVGLLVAGAFARERNRSYAAVGVLVVSLVLAALSVRQTHVWKDSMTLWNYQISAYPEAHSTPYNQRGILFHLKGEYAKAIKDYTKAAEIYDDYYLAYNNRGKSYAALRRHDMAIKDYTLALEYQPLFPDAFKNRADSYYLKRDLENALKDYTRAVEISPRFARAWYARGNIHAELGEFKEAVTDYTRAVEINPRLKDAHLNRGNAHMVQGLVKEAVVDYTSAIELDPGYKQAYKNRAGARLRLGEMREALDDFSKAASLDPRDADAHYNMALIYTKLGKRQRANENFRIAADLGHPLAKTILQVK